MPVLTFPMFFLVAYDFPRDRPYFYQTYLAFSTWLWAVYQILFMCAQLVSSPAFSDCSPCRYLCGFYDPSHSRFDCRKKDFLLTF